MRKPHVVLQLLLIFAFVPAFSAIASADEPSSADAIPASSQPTPAGHPNSAKESGTPIAIGVGVKVSTLGIGGEVGIPVSRRSNVRFGFNLFNYGHTFTKDGIAYKGTLNLRSAQATWDFFPLGALHISPGVLLYNGNNIGANASVPGGQAFTLNNTTYISDSADPIGGTGKLAVNKVAPMVLLGVGNLVPRSSRHFTSNVEIGAAYQGLPRITLNLTGSACDSTGLFCRSVSSDPTIQSNIVAEQNKLDKKARPFRFYPIISFGFGFKF
jgi:hypothetical protein